MKKNFKWYLSLSLVGAVGFSTLFLALDHKFFSSDIYLTTFDDYINPDIISEFQQETHLKVHIDSINTNEEMRAQLLLNPKSYDIIIPSDYMTNNFITNNLVQKIDYNKLTFLKNTKGDDGQKFEKNFLTEQLYSKLAAYNPNMFNYSIPYFWQFITVTYNFSDYQNHGAIMPDSSIVNKLSNNHFNNTWNWVQTLDFLITGNPYYTIAKNGKTGDHHNIFGTSKNFFQPKLDFNNDLRNLLLIGNNVHNVLHNTHNNPNPNSDIKVNAIKNMANNSYGDFMDLFSAKDSKNFKVRPIKRMDQTQADDFSYYGPTHANAMMGYNGDAITSYLNLDDSSDVIKATDFAYIAPAVNNLAVDNIMISKYVGGTRLNNVYRFINFLENKAYSNFQYVNYMPVAESLYDKVTSPADLDGSDGLGYFKNEPLQQQVLKFPKENQNYYIYNDFNNINSYQELEYIFDSKINNTNFFKSK